MDLHQLWTILSTPDNVPIGRIDRGCQRIAAGVYLALRGDPHPGLIFTAETPRRREKNKNYIGASSAPAPTWGWRAEGAEGIWANREALLCALGLLGAQSRSGLRD
jgi:hypothetical protein